MSVKKPAKVQTPAAKKPAPAAKKEPAKPNRVAPRVVKQSAAPAKPAEPPQPMDAEKAVAFAMSIAEQMKRRAAQADRRTAEEEIRLTRRPVTRSQGSETVMFPEADLKDFKKRLLAARARATSGVNAMKATGFNEADDHEADGGDGTAQTLRLQALGQMGNINRVIQQIDEALHRIDDGTYGVCTSCGQLIRKPRLINQPFVLTCMECQQEVERGVQ